MGHSEMRKKAGNCWGKEIDRCGCKNEGSRTKQSPFHV